MSVTPNVVYTSIAGHDPVPQARIIGSIECPRLEGIRNVNFLIDSGSCFTTLLSYDVVTLGIDWKSLPIATFMCRGANGVCFRPRILPDVKIHLTSNVGVPIPEVVFELPFINVVEPLKNLRDDPDPYSVLGMDVLCNFPIWRWQSDKLFLLK